MFSPGTSSENETSKRVAPEPVISPVVRLDLAGKAEETLMTVEQMERVLSNPLLLELTLSELGLRSLSEEDLLSRE